MTLADTADDSRHALAYARRTLDVALAFGARPFLSVDLMPRALAVNRTPQRDDCLWSFENRVSNARPADPAVFAAALIGALERLRLGSDGEPGRPFTHVELWNEPELPIFWDRGFEDTAGGLDRFFEMAVTALVALDVWRSASPHPEIRALRFGLAGFASAETAARMLASFEATPLPDGAHVPLDFVSFHAYADDPRVIQRAIERVRLARDGASHYGSTELVLSEWGPDLEAHASDPTYAASIEPALHAAQVVVAAALAGVGRTHRAILWDFHPGGVLTLGLASHDAAPKPLARAYELLARVIGDRTTLADSRVLSSPGMGAVLATRNAAGRLRVLFVNPSRVARRANLRIDGEERPPRKLFVLDDPAGFIHRVEPEQTLLLPPRSLLVAEY